MTLIQHKSEWIKCHGNVPDQHVQFPHNVYHYISQIHLQTYYAFRTFKKHWNFWGNTRSHWRETCTAYGMSNNARLCGKHCKFIGKSTRVTGSQGRAKPHSVALQASLYLEWAFTLGQNGETAWKEWKRRQEHTTEKARSPAAVPWGLQVFMQTQSAPLTAPCCTLWHHLVQRVLHGGPK